MYAKLSLAALAELDGLGEACIPVWAPIQWRDVLDRYDGTQLPTWWARADKTDHYFESHEQDEDFLELRRGMVDGELVVYTGPEGGTLMANAHVLGSRLDRVADAAQVLQRLEGMGLTLRGGGDFVLEGGKEPKEAGDIAALAALTKQGTQSGVDIQRYKGLGEMNADQLWESTMDPEIRNLYQVSIEDALEADHIFTVLMSDGVEARRDYIEKHALEVTNLDV